MKRIISEILIGLIVFIFATPASSLTPYDDFSGASIDKTIWGDGEFVREIDVLSQKIVFKPNSQGPKRGQIIHIGG